MKKFNTIDCKEIHAASLSAQDAADGHIPLSGYIGSKSFGGPQILVLEAMCYTMSATASVPKILGASIIFADIERETFCLDPVEVHNAITRKTKAVIVTNLFGHPAHLRELRDICDGHGVYLIEDNAQAIFAKEYGVYAGTIGHIGVFSLNVHKHLQVGEGGICVTNSSDLAKKMREAMNHGEMRGGILGLNLRMTEVTLDEINIQPPFRHGYQAPLWSLPAFKMPYRSLGYQGVVEDVEKRILLLEICSISPTDKEIIEMVESLGRINVRSG